MDKLFEEGEPTNSVSNGGIENTETPLTKKVIKRKKKKVKSFKEHLVESLLYRGHNVDFPMLGGQAIVWFSKDINLAVHYAQTSGLKDNNLTISSITYNPKNSYNAGSDNKVITADDIIIDIEKQSGKSIDIKLVNKFVKAYENVEQSIIKFWNDDNDYFADIIDSVGFDSVKLIEKSTQTLGILRKYVESKRVTKVEL